MGTNSILGAERAPTQAAGRDTEALGPSDSSDSGSDIRGEPHLNPRSDREEVLTAPHTDYAGSTDGSGTGERGSALPDERIRDGDDISPDHIENFETDDEDEEMSDALDIEELDADDEAIAEAFGGAIPHH